MEDVARRPPSYLKILFLVAGGRGTEATVLLWFPYFNNDAKNNEAEYLKVGPGSPCPVLQQSNMFYNNQSMFPNIQNMFPHGGRGTETTVLLKEAYI